MECNDRVVACKITDFALQNEPLSAHTTFHIGGYAESFYIVKNLNDLKNILQFANKTNTPIFIIGNGSNLLISNQGLRGITIKLGAGFKSITQNNNEIKIGAAASLSQLLKYALIHSLTGVEFVWGIPGTFGGAVICNTGAFSQDIGSLITKINGILPNGKEISLNRNQIDCRYRKITLPNGFIITDGLLNLTFSEQKIIKQKIKDYREKRKKTQPDGASAGSVFKNPSFTPAGKLIEENNLKGLKIGNAYISKKHGNFIVNQGNAHFNDVYELIQIIKSTVEIKIGTILEEEIQILPKARR